MEEYNLAKSRMCDACEAVQLLADVTRGLDGLEDVTAKAFALLSAIVEALDK